MATVLGLLHLPVGSDSLVLTEPQLEEGLWKAGDSLGLRGCPPSQEEPSR